MLQCFHVLLFTVPGSSPITSSSSLIFPTALCEARLYSKGSWETRKQSGLRSEVGRGESGTSVRNILPGEWLKARGGSRKRWRRMTVLMRVMDNSDKAQRQLTLKGQVGVTKQSVKCRLKPDNSIMWLNGLQPKLSKNASFIQACELCKEIVC